MQHLINPELVKLARANVHRKRAFVPSDAVMQAAGPPPGGAPGGAPGGPPGGAPPGGPPPGPGPSGPPPGSPPGGDPTAGSTSPSPPPMDPMGGMGDIDAKVQSAVQRAMQMSNPQGNAQGPGGAPKLPKPDIATVATDLFQLKKMFLAYLRRQGVELPPDILDGPNRDPMTGAASASPTGGSDIGAGAEQVAGAIPQIEPIQPAMPPGAPKQASFLSETAAAAYLVKEASDVLRLYSVILDRQALAEDLLAEVEAEKTAAATAVEPESPGEVFPAPAAARQVHNKAAAVAGMFHRRRTG